MERDIEKIEEFYCAYQKRDVNAMLLYMDKDVRVKISPELPWGGEFQGHEGVRQFIAAQSRYLEARVSVERLIDAGSEVAAVGRILGKARTTQLQFDVPLVHIWSFREGQVVRFESYLDNATMLAVLGV